MLIPATANTIAKLATGIADNLLLSTLLASNCPTKIIIPAMNSVMWSNPIIQEKVNRLCQLGYECWGPDYGVQLCGEIGYGNLITNEQILANLTAKFMSSQSDKLANYHFVVSGGGTREYLDPVRYLSNHSSGKMALAVVNNLIAHGAKVTFILGSNALNLQQLNPKIKLVLVDTAETMLNAVLNNLTPQSIFIAIAAVCDYKPKNYSTHKLKKNASEPILELIKNVDILAKVRQTYPQLCMVGFACETENLTQYLEQKFYAKQLNLIVGNQVTNDNPIFNHDDNQVVLFDGKDFEEHQLANKDVIAQAIITKLEQILCI
jgi:phosphopantothenoylcysteine decarboxylase/phosphopantothenate--cysteine ligase